MAYALHAERVQQVSIFARYQNVDVVNVLHYTIDPGPGWQAPGPNSTNLLNEVTDQFLAAFRPLQSTSLSYLKATAKQCTGWFPGMGPAPVEIVPIFDAQDEIPLVGIAGLLPGDGLPTYVSCTARKKTNTPTRQFRGSTRFAGLVESQTDPGLFNFLTNAAFTAWDTAWTGFRSAVIQLTVGVPANSVSMCVFSLKNLQTLIGPNLPFTTILATRKVTAGQVNGYVGSQLSRKFRQPG